MMELSNPAFCSKSAQLWGQFLSPLLVRIEGEGCKSSLDNQSSTWLFTQPKKLFLVYISHFSLCCCLLSTQQTLLMGLTCIFSLVQLVSGPSTFHFFSLNKSSFLSLTSWMTCFIPPHHNIIKIFLKWILQRDLFWVHAHCDIFF